jgi:hypothetical protein
MTWKEICLLSVLACAMVMTWTGCNISAGTDIHLLSSTPPKQPQFVKSPKPGNGLAEAEVLGVETNTVATDETIRKTLEQGHNVQMRPGSNLLLLHSGYSEPEKAMIGEMNRYFRVINYSGLTIHDPGVTNADTCARFLRLAAARLGAESLVCYWTTSEYSRRDLPGKSISWVPVVGRIIPDEMERVRVRITFAAVDVRTGQWALHAAAPVEEEVRRSEHQRELEETDFNRQLKTRAYKSAAQEFLRLYMVK